MRINTQAVTIAMNAKDAAILISNRMIRIEMVNCSIEKRYNIKKRRKCWQHDHEAKERTKSCKKKRTKSVTKHVTKLERVYTKTFEDIYHN